MRPVESLLSLTTLLTFFVLALPLPRGVFWIRYLAPIVLLIAVVQLLAEGSRWQLVPAYTLAGLFFLVWLLQSIVPLDVPVGQILNNRVAIGLAVVLSILGLVVSIALPIVLPVFHFPHPGGPYEIGTLTYYWVDTDRPEVFSTDPNARRELMVQIWYPARKESTSPACSVYTRFRFGHYRSGAPAQFSGFFLEPPQVRYHKRHLVRTRCG